MKETFKYPNSFELELGDKLPEIEIAYYTYGNLNANKDNVIWICHALTASADVEDWWSGLVGKGKIFDPEKYFIVCANILGSCYGTTGPTSLNPTTAQKYGIDFPFFTIRDMVKAHQLLQKHLGIERIQILAGGSMGGYQALEWAIMDAISIENLFLIATSAEESAWGKAIHAAQRMAITADPNWAKGEIGLGDHGLKAARAFGMLTYRNYELFKSQQSDTNLSTFQNHRAATYVQYQAEKLAGRFDALTYFKLSEAMDTHQLARNRASLEVVIGSIEQNVLVVGISSDILCPKEEQILLANHLPNSVYREIDSAYGHDGFLVESEKIKDILQDWISDKKIFIASTHDKKYNKL